MLTPLAFARLRNRLCLLSGIRIVNVLIPFPFSDVLALRFEERGEEANTFRHEKEAICEKGPRGLTNPHIEGRELPQRWAEHALQNSRAKRCGYVRKRLSELRQEH
jgi:hypothetical protein